MRHFPVWSHVWEVEIKATLNADYTCWEARFFFFVRQSSGVNLWSMASNRVINLSEKINTTPGNKLIPIYS